MDLIESSPSLRVLNIESNFISPELLAKLLRATLKTQNLIEFHAENQVTFFLNYLLDKAVEAHFQRNIVYIEV